MLGSQPEQEPAWASCACGWLEVVRWKSPPRKGLAPQTLEDGGLGKVRRIKRSPPLLSIPNKIKGVQENTTWFQVVFLLFWPACVQPALLIVYFCILRSVPKGLRKKDFPRRYQEPYPSSQEPWTPEPGANPVLESTHSQSQLRLPHLRVASSVQLFIKQDKRQHRPLRPGRHVCKKIGSHHFLSFYSVPYSVPNILLPLPCHTQSLPLMYHEHLDLSSFA